MRKSLRRQLLTLTISTTAIIAGTFFPVVASEIHTKAQTNDVRFNGISEYMLTTESGVPLTLPLSKNPIAIVFDNLSETEKDLAIQAIQELDEISENINYTILDADDYKITQKIILQSDDSLSDNKVGGTANFSYNNFTGKINYPITVSLDPDYTRYVSTVNGENMYTSIVKHEMMHTLGFKDIYDKDSKYDSIMYYDISHDERALDYTERDKKCIRQVYDNEQIKISKPDKLVVNNKTYNTSAKKEEDFTY
ncbi:MAG: hypothetical protein J6Q51_03445 [Clostridia bacterium]|nr:hypothetical protein [Clostridia bacterium]